MSILTRNGVMSIDVSELNEYCVEKTFPALSFPGSTRNVVCGFNLTTAHFS